MIPQSVLDIDLGQGGEGGGVRVDILVRCQLRPSGLQRFSQKRKLIGDDRLPTKRVWNNYFVKNSHEIFLVCTWRHQNSKIKCILLTIEQFQFPNFHRAWHQEDGCGRAVPCLQNDSAGDFQHSKQCKYKEKPLSKFSKVQKWENKPLFWNLKYC